MPAGFDGDVAGAQMNVDLRVRGQEFGGQQDQLRGRSGDLQVVQKYPGNPLVHQNPAVLGVVLELDDVEVAVIGFQQVRLCPAAHLADVSARGERHGNAVI